MTHFTRDTDAHPGLLWSHSDHRTDVPSVQKGPDVTKRTAGPDTATAAASAAAASIDDLAHATEVFSAVRRRLFGIAYRMLGTVSEAEDIVQDVWLRWQTCDRSTVLDPPAFLATATTRLAINVLQSARSRRETYIGPWLPEPVNTDDDPRSAPNAARRWVSRCCSCSRSSPPPSVRPTCCVRPSTTPTPRSPRSCNSRSPRPASS